MENREETPKASLIAQSKPKRQHELSDIGAVRDPDGPHGFTPLVDPSTGREHDHGPDS